MNEVSREIEVDGVKFLAEKDRRFSFWSLELKSKLPKATLRKGSHRFTTFDKAEGFAKNFVQSASAKALRKGSTNKED
jgi:hypothetical protein